MHNKASKMLYVMEKLKIDFTDNNSVNDSIVNLSNLIANDFVLKINDSIYQIVDFEFYVHSKKHFDDPFTHKHIQQLKCGTLYLHPSGVDITCGDGFNYGGILLRSIVKLHSKEENQIGLVKQFEGPLIVATELFSNLNPLNGELNEISLIRRSDIFGDIVSMPVQKVLSTSRVGLKRKEGDLKDEYFNLKSRFIAVLTRNSVFKQSIKGFERLLLENTDDKSFTKADADLLAGYKIPI